MSTFNDLPRELQVLILGKAFKTKESEKNNLEYHIKRFESLEEVYIHNYNHSRHLYKLLSGYSKKQVMLYLIKQSIYNFMTNNYGLDIDEIDLEEP
jgi:hypothetical protein